MGTIGNPARRLGAGLWVVLLGMVLAGTHGGAKAQVALELRVPKAETWVLGDSIPLHWRFSNQSTQALGFMWEGCCRLNGRLDVRRGVDGGRLETVPPGQALAHMFAKADRLEPGISKDYDTQVSDWVALPGTGRYLLEGTYRGVLPTQFPQVPRGLAVWKNAATSAPVELAILGVDDYLREREARRIQGGMTVRLEGPARLPPLESVRFVVTLENRGAAERSLLWPDDVGLWVLDRGRHRVAPMAVIPGATTRLTVPPGGSVVREFQVATDRFETEPLGDFDVFVDLGAGASGQPRVPSNVLRLVWRLDSKQVVELLERAAQGAGTGARNAALKLLRVYLGELGSAVSGLDRATLSPDARRLADRLELASRLRPLAAKPGMVGLPVAVGPSGEVRWSERSVADAFRAGTGDVRSQLSEVLGVRRHLGWEVTLVMVPDVDTSLRAVEEAVEGLRQDEAEWAGPPEIRMEMGGTNAPVRLVLRSAVVGAPVAPDAGVVRRDGGAWRLDLPARAVGQPERPEPAVVGLSRVWVPSEVGWGELRGLLGPVGTAGGRVELWITGPGGA